MRRPSHHPLARLAVALAATLVACGVSSAEPEAELGSLPTGTGSLELHRRLADEFANVDPNETGWESESLSEEVSGRMKTVAKLLVHPAKLDAETLAALLADPFTSGPLQFSDLQPITANASMRVAAPPGDVEQTAASRQHTPAEFAEQFRALASALEGTADPHVKFKVMHVEMKGAHALTKLLFEMSGRSPEGWVQVTSTWDCEWTTDTPHRLRSVRVSEYREAGPGTGGRIEFVDAAPAVLAETHGYAAHLAYSFDYWRARSDRSLVSDLLGRQGVAVADVNGDGLEDVYLTQPGGLPNRLFLRQPDGTARDGGAEAGVDFLDFGRSALLVDLDNDGDRDLVLGLAWKICLFENDGRGRFTARAEFPSDGQVNSLAAADYDNDGDLDLFVCGQHPSGAIMAELGVLGIPMPYYDANNGGPNKLCRNEGGFAFVDVTAEVGMDVNNRRFSLACAWEDFDNDGDQDLYVANDFGRNNLYRNDPGPEPGTRTFTDIAASAKVEDVGPGMSVAWGDYNRDGLPDLYVANMWSNAGNRITLQERFLPGAGDELRDQARRHARGNSAYLNMGDGTFRDVTRESGANMGRWAWGSNFIELDNDGHQDLVVANGMITARATGDL